MPEIKFYRFGSGQNLVSFFFHLKYVLIFVAEAGIIFNVFLNFEQK